MLVLRFSSGIRVTVIDPIGIAQADKQVEIAEVTLCELGRVATEKGHIAYGANAFNERAWEEYEEAMKMLTNLRERLSRNTTTEVQVARLLPPFGRSTHPPTALMIPPWIT